MSSYRQGARFAIQKPESLMRKTYPERLELGTAACFIIAMQPPSKSIHRGYFLNAAANAKVSPILKKSTCGELGLKGWYEEDCDWAIAIFTFRECFEETHCKEAIESLERFHAKAWSKLHKKTDLSPLMKLSPASELGFLSMGP